MAIDQESFNVSLFNILKTRGYRPVPKDLKNQRTQPESAEVFNFTFTKEGKDYGDAWVTIDDAQNLILYYDNEQEESPSGKTHGLDYDDSWFGFKKLLKRWAMSKQLAFELKNKDKLGDDMAQRDYVTKKEKMNETKEERSLWDPSHCPTCDTRLRKVLGSSNAQCDKCMKIVKVKLKKHPKQMDEGYYRVKHQPKGKNRCKFDTIKAKDMTDANKIVKTNAAFKNSEIVSIDRLVDHPEKNAMGSGEKHKTVNEGYHPMEGEVVPFKRPERKIGSAKDEVFVKQAYQDGLELGFSVTDPITAQKALKIRHWDHPREDVSYSSDFIRGFMKGRQNKINWNNKEYNMNLQINDDGSIINLTEGYHTTDNELYVVKYWDGNSQNSPVTKEVRGKEKATSVLNALPKHYKKAMTPKSGIASNQANMYEGYHPMGKKASYNDNIPAVKIILQHNRQIEEGEQRYRNIAKIYLENTNGERFLAPTTRPSIAQVYARHIAEGGVPNDERWNHIKSLCEEYSKMAGFIRATKNKQFNESAQQLVNEGINHYQSLRETLGKLRGHRGYNQYFESWTPALMEDETDGTQINELFVQETVDPRIESVMPILSRLHKKTGETQVKEVKELEQWADSIVEGSEWERRHDEFVRVGEKVTSQEVRSIIEQLKKVLEVAGKKSGMLNQIFGKVSNQQLAMDSVAAAQFIRTLTRLIDAKPGTDERKELGQIVTYAKSLLRKATYLPNQDGMMAEGEDDIFRTSINDFDPEDMEVNNPPSPVESAILRRITHGRPDLLKHGPKAVLDAVKEVADFVGDVEEIGSSDVSGWIKQVERILGHKEIDEDLSSMMRKGAKKVQRAFSFWDGSAHLEDLKDYVKNASDNTLIRLAKHAKDDPKLHSPRAVQIKLIDRELKRRFGLTPKGNIKPEETLEGTYDRRLGHHVPRDGRVFSQHNHPRVETCEFCGQETGKAGPGEGSLYDNDGNGPYCEDCYDKAKTDEPDLFSENLDKNQKKAGQLGPTEKVGKKGAVGKLVGVSESSLDRTLSKTYKKGARVKIDNPGDPDHGKEGFLIKTRKPGENTLGVRFDKSLVSTLQNIKNIKPISESVNVEEGSPEHEVIMDLINGNLDAYDVMNYPKTPAQQQVAAKMQERYDEIANEYPLHADDDFEKILDKLVDELADDYDTSGYTQAMSESELADLSKVKTEKLQELVALFRYYGQRDPRAKAAAERGAAELKKRGMHVPIDEGQEDLDAIKRLMK